MSTQVIFDLDGTLTDSREGIIRSVAYALTKEGETTAGRLAAETIIGPPLWETFCGTYGFSEAKARRVYAFFQERYSTIGKYENKPFAQVPEMLATLTRAGLAVYVATSKLEVHARDICEHFHLLPYIREIAGPQVGGTDTKADCIRRILRSIGPQAHRTAVMVGDRRFDVEGARSNRIPVIAAAYGYGSEEERRAYPPDRTVDSVAALTQVLLQWQDKEKREI